MDYNMELMTPRDWYPRKKVVESPELGKLDKAEQLQSKRHKNKMFVNMTKDCPRDNRMYNNGEWYKNCKNEEEVHKKHVLKLKSQVKDIEEVYY